MKGLIEKQDKLNLQHISISEIPIEDRPRERLTTSGAHSLSHAELLAILIRTGTHRESALHLAQRLLCQSGGLRGLVQMSLQELTKIKGIGPIKAVQLLASMELGKRIIESLNQKSFCIQSPLDVVAYFKQSLKYIEKEIFIVLFLDKKRHVIECETLCIGGLDYTVVQVRDIYKAAVKRSSDAIICVHNHPGGLPTPSQADIQLTKLISDAGEMLGIKCLDHIIIADDQFISLKEQHLM